MRRSLFQRLRPFLRRDLQARLLGGGITAVAWAALAWLAVAALMRIDTPDAQRLRIAWGLETPGEVCGGAQRPECTYDDRTQAKIDLQFAQAHALRVAILDELQRRIESDLPALEHAHARVQAGSSPLRPIVEGLPPRRPSLRPAGGGRSDLRWEWSDIASEIDRDGLGAAEAERRRDGLAALLTENVSSLLDIRVTLEHLRQREPDIPLVAPSESSDTHLSLHRRDVLRWWLEDAPGTLAPSLTTWADRDPRALWSAVFQSDADVWEGGWSDAPTPHDPIRPSAIRYRSPIPAAVQWRCFAAVLLAAGALLWLVVGPTVAATTTASERASGTLPLLRMTGLSASDLMWAFAVGPNAFIAVAGGSLLLAGATIAGATGAAVATASAVLAVGLLAVTSHVIAVAAGEAAGRYLQPLVVGAWIGTAIAGPGIVGFLWLACDLGSAGLLLGPLPAALTAVAAVTELPVVSHLAWGEGSPWGSWVAASALGVQVVLALLMHASWRRRVERPGTPLFGTTGGALVAIVSVLCGALAMLDLSATVVIETYDEANLVTAVSASFLAPLLGWVLISTLGDAPAAARRRDHVRRTFLRVQWIFLLAGGVLAATYGAVVGAAELEPGASIMSATLAQAWLGVETAIAALLLGCRRHGGRHAWLAIGAVVASLQMAATAMIYHLEVDHLTLGPPIGPFRLAIEASPYLLVFLVVLWGTGLGLILTALLRERDRTAAENPPPSDPGGEDDDEDDDRPRWLH